MNELRAVPQATDIERAVLGAMLIDNDCIPLVVAALKDETAFYATSHRIVFKTIVALFKENIPADQVTVTEELVKKKSKVSALTVAEIASEMATAANAEYHAKIILEKAHRRRLIALGQAAIDQGFDSENINKDLEISKKRILWLLQQEFSGNSLDYATRYALLELSLIHISEPTRPY